MVISETLTCGLVGVVAVGKVLPLAHLLTSKLRARRFPKIIMRDTHGQPPKGMQELVRALVGVLELVLEGMLEV
jgi:hypothetical protein